MVKTKRDNRLQRDYPDKAAHGIITGLALSLAVLVAVGAVLFLADAIWAVAPLADPAKKTAAAGTLTATMALVMTGAAVIRYRSYYPWRLLAGTALLFWVLSANCWIIVVTL